MISRRDILLSTAAVTVLPGTVLAAPETQSLCDFVDPFIGTGGHGHNFPGATVPFGMVQLSPDTSNNGWDSCAGYHQQDGSILGFSHTHLSGTGCPDLLDLLVVPRTGPVVLAPGTLEAPQTGYRSRYDRATETATPGYYSVELTDSRVRAELTATKRAGLHRYTFPRGEAGHLLIDWHHANLNWWDKPPVPHVQNATLRLVGSDTLVGGRQVSQWAKDRWIFFALKLSRPFTSATLYSDDAAVVGTEAEGGNLKCALHFGDAGASPLLVRASVSAVDIDGALRNLEAELPDFGFERVGADARAAWERELARVRIETGDATARRIFHTAHYHTMMAPTLFNDVDGRYRGMDNAIHQLKPGEENYSTYSLWDQYRASHPFFILAHGERVPDIVATLVRMGQESPAGPPIWPLQGRETDTMVGYHSAVVLAEAWRKGVKGVDYEAAYAVMRKRAFQDNVHGLDWYRRLGYIPADKVDESVSRTLEFAYDDWAVSKLAEAAGQRLEADVLRQRSRSYRNVFDPYIGFMRGRLSDGEWVTPYWPASLGYNQKIWRDFTESNGWQATFLNQHDIYGYMTLFGGEAAFAAKLDGLFDASSDMPDGTLADISGLIGQYAHGNEPSHHVAYLYAYAGAPWKTQARVRQVLTTLYAAAPDGLAGNEDCGQMSAWYVLSAMGFYPVDPVSAVYVLGSPLFDKATIAVGEGRTFVVEAPGNGPDAPYIQSAALNGRPLTRSWITHAEIMHGGHLVLRMGKMPNTSFGHSPADRPPSFA